MEELVVPVKGEAQELDGLRVGALEAQFASRKEAVLAQASILVHGGPRARLGVEENAANATQVAVGLELALQVDDVGAHGGDSLAISSTRARVVTPQMLLSHLASERYGA
ncbi:formate--tetrahydrofolate ligase [Babesia caballi]|uniref:Formate--tetrahydrofolate ligase n=1 Tax=Babesia caballi TaxID=5871 RepID=A0AAV4LN57_BABCB|nr:formate--tetrahydrofolate ligase [Babesia caballi]